MHPPTGRRLPKPRRLCDDERVFATMKSYVSLDVAITTDGVVLQGMLVIPDVAYGLVAFAHGSGSSRFSDRNQYVARVLNQGGLATLLFDLLTASEHARDMQTAEYRFDVMLLAKRLTGTVDWLSQEETTRVLEVGLFGASTGAAGALIAAALRPQVVRAVVSRGGRPDLAHDALGKVHAPTLFIVGGDDSEVIELNKKAALALSCKHQTVIIPGAGHLFEKPNELGEVATLARSWFVTYLAPTTR